MRLVVKIQLVEIIVFTEARVVKNVATAMYHISEELLISLDEKQKPTLVLQCRNPSIFDGLGLWQSPIMWEKHTARSSADTEKAHHMLL